MIKNAEGQVAGLTILLQLSRRIREAATAKEIGLIAVNESKQLLPYRQSALWMYDHGVLSVSGIPDPDRSAPYVQWLTECCKQWQKLDATSCSSPDDFSGELSRSWHEWAPFNVALAPLKSKGGENFGMLILFREDSWNTDELALLNELVSIYAQGFASLYNHHDSFWKKIRKNALSTATKTVLVILVAVSMFYPIHMSVQAPAEVVPKDPFVVRSPLDAVIDKFHVKPNQMVTEGHLLFEFDRINLSAKHAIADTAYQTAVEEYRQASQTALVDDKFRSEITLRRGRMEEKETELSFSLKRLEKANVRAPRPGIVIFAEQSDWIGKNVTIGERVLTIANPNMVEILIRLPVQDAIDFPLGSPVKLYLTSDPQHPLDATLRYAAYKPEIASAGIVAYRLKADFVDISKRPRIGLTGTARVYGNKVSLGYYLFRRPLTALRQHLGW